MKTYTFKTPAEGAKLFGCTVKNYRTQLESNRAGILALLRKARATGKKANGYSESELEQMVIGYNRALAVGENANELSTASVDAIAQS